MNVSVKRVLLFAFFAVLPLLWYFEPILAGKVYCTDDLAAQYYPWWTFMSESLRNGSWPLWNPHVFCGMPYYTNPETAMYYPLKMPFVFMPFSFAAGLVRILDAVVASAGMFLLLRYYGTRTFAALCGALLFTYGSFMQYEFVHIPYVNTASWAPVTLYLLLRLTDSPSLRGAVLLALSEGCALSGGSPVVFLISNMAIAVFWLFYVLSRGGSVIRGKVGLPGYLTVAVMLFCLLSAVLVVPVLQFISLSSRAGGIADVTSYFNFSLPAHAAVLTVMPALNVAYGAPYPPLHPVYPVNIPYLGMLTPLLALFAFAGRYRNRVGLPAVVCIVFGVFMALGVNTGLFASVVNALPFLKWFRWPNDFMLMAYMALAVAGGIGIDALMRIEPGRYKQVSVICVVYLGLSVHCLAIMPLWVIAAASAGLCAVCFAAFRKVDSAPAYGAGLKSVSLAIMAIICLDLYWYGSKYRIFADKADVSASHLDKVREFVASNAGDGRVSFGDSGWQVYFLGQKKYHAGNIPLFAPDFKTANWPDLQDWLSMVRKDKRDARIQLQPYIFSDIDEWSLSYPVNWAMVRGYKDISVYDPFHLRDVEKLFSSVPVETVWDVCGVKYIVRPSSAASSKASVFSDNGIGVSENRDCLPFVSVAHKFARVESIDGIAALLNSKGFDPRETVIVSGLKQNVVPASGNAGRSEVQLRKASRERIEFTADMSAPGFAVVNDAWYPGWKAYVDGEPRDVVKAFGVLKAVYLEAGRHEVVLMFRPVVYFVSAAVSCFGVLVAFLILLRYRAGKTGVAVLPDAVQELASVSSSRAPLAAALTIIALVLVLAIYGSQSLCPTVSLSPERPAVSGAEIMDAGVYPANAAIKSANGFIMLSQVPVELNLKKFQGRRLSMTVRCRRLGVSEASPILRVTCPDGRTEVVMVEADDFCDYKVDVGRVVSRGRCIIEYINDNSAKRGEMDVEVAGIILSIL